MDTLAEMKLFGQRVWSEHNSLPGRQDIVGLEDCKYQYFILEYETIMNFELANLQKQIHLAAREFAGGESVTIGKVCEANGELPKEIIKKAV